MLRLLFSIRFRYEAEIPSRAARPDCVIPRAWRRSRIFGPITERGMRSPIASAAIAAAQGE